MSTEDVDLLHRTLRDPAKQSLLEAKNSELQSQGRTRYGGRSVKLQVNDRLFISAREFTDIEAAQDWLAVWNQIGNQIPESGDNVYFTLVSREIVENTTKEEVLV
jgi:hypothetical protein